MNNVSHSSFTLFEWMSDEGKEGGPQDGRPNVCETYKYW